MRPFADGDGLMVDLCGQSEVDCFRTGFANLAGIGLFLCVFGLSFDSGWIVDFVFGMCSNVLRLFFLFENSIYN